LGRRSRRCAGCPSRGRRAPAAGRPRARRRRRRPWSRAPPTRGICSTRRPDRLRACAPPTAWRCRPPTVSTARAGSRRRHASPRHRQSHLPPPPKSLPVGTTTTPSRAWSRSARCRLLRCVSSLAKDSPVVSFPSFCSCCPDASFSVRFPPLVCSSIS
jgi:hypothetical protein